MIFLRLTSTSTSGETYFENLAYSKTSPIEQRKFERYQPELRNPVAIPLMVV